MRGTVGSVGEHTGRRTVSWLSLAGLLLLALLLPATAFGASTKLQVSLTIKPWLKFSAAPRVASYQVDAAAIRRGYVDIPASLDVELVTNLRNEVQLALVGVGPETIQVLDGGAASPEMLRFDAVANNAPITKSFGLRVLLPPGLGEGTYPLRLQVSAAMI